MASLESVVALNRDRQTSPSGSGIRGIYQSVDSNGLSKRDLAGGNSLRRDR